ncbi:WxL protein peptidoglycan domain-containing protein [Phytohabitans kaempferiae]|uniref:WxL protein peptidoglycan domain-containing protein n=1 Tax=Phytohabitans kaempferiae TaxID=1620943 RepID=A0ABV6MB78_9ACTN
MRRTTGRCPSAHLFAALAGLLAVLVAAPPAAAAPTPAPAADAGFTWAVQPSGKDGPTGRSYFVYDAAPGQRIDDRVAVTNLGTQPMTFAVYGSDAYTTADGSFALQPASHRAADVGAWTSFGARAYQVAAGKRVVIPFQLTVPANASPGDHAGGIVASVVQAQAGGGGRVNLDRRVAARIYLRVAGAVRPAVQVEAMKIGYENPLNPVGTAPVVVMYRVRNTGNVRVAGSGHVQIQAPFGWKLAGTEPARLPELLPGSAITITEQVNGIVPAGRLGIRVTVEASTADSKLPAVTRSAGQWAVPWLWVALLAVVAVVLVARRVRTLRRRRAG